MGQLDSERTISEEEARFIEHAKDEIISGLERLQASCPPETVEKAASLVSEAIAFPDCKGIVVGLSEGRLIVFNLRENKTPVKHQFGLTNSLRLSATRQRDLEKFGITHFSISSSASPEDFGASVICSFDKWVGM